MPKLTPRKQPKQSRSRALVAAMHEATRRTLLKEGFNATTVAEIARVAGVSPGSVYQYFPTKESIISSLHVALAEDALAYLADNLLEVRDASLDEVAGVLVGVPLRLARDDAPLFRVLDEAAAEIGTARKLAAVSEQTHKLLAGFIASRDDIARPPKLSAFVLATSLVAMIRRALHTGDMLEDDAFFEELHAFTHHYLRSECMS